MLNAVNKYDNNYLYHICCFRITIDYFDTHKLVFGVIFSLHDSVHHHRHWFNCLFVYVSAALSLRQSIFQSPLPFLPPTPSPLSLLSPWSRGCCAKVGGINLPWGVCGKLPALRPRHSQYYWYSISCHLTLHRYLFSTNLSHHREPSNGRTVRLHRSLTGPHCWLAVVQSSVERQSISVSSVQYYLKGRDQRNIYFITHHVTWFQPITIEHCYPPYRSKVLSLLGFSLSGCRYLGDVAPRYIDVKFCTMVNVSVPDRSSLLLGQCGAPRISPIRSFGPKFRPFVREYPKTVSWASHVN